MKTIMLGFLILAGFYQNTHAMFCTETVLTTSPEAIEGIYFIGILSLILGYKMSPSLDGLLGLLYAVELFHKASLTVACQYVYGRPN